MTYYKMTKYTLLGFNRAANQTKKYDAILQSIRSGRTVRVPFGQRGYQHYKDQIGYYSDFDHYDKNRRRSFLARNENNIKAGYFSPGYFSATYLW